MKNNIINFILLTFLISCSGLEKEHVVGNYFLVKPDNIEEDLDLSYYLEKSGDFIGVVGATVIAVGYNNDYIIVKQHPKEFAESSNELITNYFIIPLTNKVHEFSDENKLGPLSKEKFKEMRKKLGLPESLTFRNNLKNLE